MRVTRRYWTVALLGAVLAIGSPVLDSLILLGGATLLWGWLLARQYTFVQTIDDATTDLDIELRISDRTVVTDERTALVVRAEIGRIPDVDVSLVASLPPAGTDLTPDARRVVLDGEGPSTSEFLVEWPIAGTFEAGPVDVTVEDRYGLFTSEHTVDATETVSVVPRRPEEIHVGEGGEQVSIVSGEHEVGKRGSGFEPLEIRKYIPGDDIRRIDWKATARLGDVHIREYEHTSIRTTLIVFDHRSGLDTGPEGATEIDYLRHLGLAYVDSAAEFDDPVGLVGVGDEGISVVESPKATQRSYDRIRSLLHEFSVSEVEDDTKTTTRAANQYDYWSPQAARAAADRLSGERSKLTRRLEPFFDRPDGYVQRIDDDPLFTTVKAYTPGHPGPVLTVFLTDGARRSELYEAVKAATQGENQAIVFMTPNALFEPTGVDRLGDLYERYIEFEQFRRRLHRLERVSAFEVAPSDRLEAVLDVEQPIGDTAERPDVEVSNQ